MAWPGHFSLFAFADKQYFDFCVNDKIAMFAICYCWRCARKTVHGEAGKCVFVYFANTFMRLARTIDPIRE